MRRRATLLVLSLASVALLGACDRVEQSAGATSAALRSDEPATPLGTGRSALAAIAKATPAPESGSCPADMILVEGNYCPNVELNCKRYVDPEGTYEHFRCGEYGPSTCKSKARRHLRYCIDKH